jgi:hypothetical protein
MAYEEEAAIKQLFSSTVQVDQECMDRCNILYHLALCYHTLNPILQHLQTIESQYRELVPKHLRSQRVHETIQP